VKGRTFDYLLLKILYFHTKCLAGSLNKGAHGCRGYTEHQSEADHALVPYQRHLKWLATVQQCHQRYETVKWKICVVDDLVWLEKNFLER
jgi:hypothetical protein